MPLCRPTFGIIFRSSEWGIICESLNLLVIQKNTVMVMYFNFIEQKKQCSMPRESLVEN